MKQMEQKIIKGIIVVQTGLHIGAGNERVEIGGMDNPIIRNPLSREPYIPGSSIKGKMRSLLEFDLGKISKDGPYSSNEPLCPISRVFGAGNNKDNNPERGPSRLIVRDAHLTKEWSEKFTAGKPIVEEKYENTIDRISAVANPRPIERVVAGVKFDFEMVYKIIDTGDTGATDEKYLKEVVLRGLKLLENDYLGGGGTRGNGRVKFESLTIDGKPVTLGE